MGFTSPLWGNFVICRTGSNVFLWRGNGFCAHLLKVCVFLIFSPFVRLAEKTEKPETFRFRAFYWSEWRDLNSRPLDPQSSALPTALHPVILFVAVPYRSQLCYISMASNKMQAFFLIFLKNFEKDKNGLKGQRNGCPTAKKTAE